MLADFGDVFPTLLARSISLQIVAVGKTQLARERLQDRRRHRYGIIEEGTEIADGSELQRETQAVAFTPAARDLCQIVIVEVVVAGQLVGRGRDRVTSVVFTLLRGEETNRHAGIRPRLQRAQVRSVRSGATETPMIPPPRPGDLSA